MPLLSEREKAEVVAEICRLILASGQTAQLLRLDPGENLFGHDEEKFVEVGSIPIELNATPPDDLPGNIDAVASVLPEAAVEAAQRLAVGEGIFRIQNVVEEHLFGVITHKTLRLVKIHGR